MSPPAFGRSGLALLTLCAVLLWPAAQAQQPSTAERRGAGLEPSSIEAELRQRAEAQFTLGDIAGALATHGVLETALTGAARSASRDALWTALNGLPVNTDFSAVTEPTALGWVQLLQLVRSNAPLSAFEDWRQRHPDHPGESQIATGMVTPARPSGGNGRQIALLLPLTGPLAAAAKAIHAGAEAARVRTGADAPGLLLFDTTPGVPATVAGALANGAVALIGPLRKEDVAAFAAQPPSLPTITLNYLDAGRARPAGLTPFGLAPEDEAQAAADHATGRSLLRAVIFAQEGDWGSRNAAAFKARFEQRGGVVLASETFKPASVDFSPALKRLLGIGLSEARGKELAATGIKAELKPAPRGDIDVVFIAARSAQAKLIWPQLRYLRAGQIATYAPGTAADAGNRDLGKLNICDAPWRIANQGPMAALRGELAAVNPRSADAQRLFALGYDAYDLARRAAAQGLAATEELAGLTGRLVVDADGAVHRRLECISLYTPPLEGQPAEPIE